MHIPRTAGSIHLRCLYIQRKCILPAVLGICREYTFTLNVQAVKENGETVLTFKLCDQGTPFDPTQTEDVDTTLSAQEREIGGLGIFLVRQLMDDVSYQYVNGSNVLTMTKRV